MNKSKLVSVCIPVFNGKDFIAEAVDSALKQTYQNLEILVQDNASTDGTWEIVCDLAKKDPRISAERNPSNIGMAPNWNKVLARARGDFLALLNADDYYQADFVENSLSILKKSRADIVSSNHYNVVHGVKRRRRVFLREGIYYNFPGIILLFNPFPIVFSVFAREFYSRMSDSGKLFNENYNLTCDYELLLRLSSSGLKLFYCSTPKAYYRVHDSNLSRQRLKMNRLAILTIFRHGKMLMENCNTILRFTILRFILRVLLNYFRNGTLDKRCIKCLLGRFMYGF